MWRQTEVMRSSFAPSRVCLQQYDSMGMSHFAIIYRKVPHDLIDLAQLLVG